MNKRSLFKVIGVISAVMILIVLTAVITMPQSRYYVCLVNDTDEYVNYSSEWCTRAGENCTGFRRWTLAPGNSSRHWADGRGKMIVRIHTGGPGGIVKTYHLYASTGGCNSSSRSYIRYNNQGFLRIYSY